MSLQAVARLKPTAKEVLVGVEAAMLEINGVPLPQRIATFMVAASLEVG